MAPRYRVTLTSDERNMLESITKKGKHDSRTVIHARALLLCDAGPEGSAWKSAMINEALGVTERTIERLKKRFVENGIEEALQRKPMMQGKRDIKFDGAFEARLVALACSKAPEGHARWTVRLLADKLVELSYTDKVSPMTVQRVLKKTHLSLT